MELDLPPPNLVQDDRGVRRLAEVLERADEIAVDIESNSFFNYRERVCLIQVSALDEDWIVDPLAPLDLSPLGGALADPSKQKVFHDGEYDVLSLKRDFGFAFKNLFDTRIAAAVLGSKEPGLASVLSGRFGIQLDKSMQRSNWAERPLSPKQVAYARLDTRFLVPLMREQKEELEDRGRTMIVEGECRRLERLVPPDASFDADEFVRIKGVRALRPLDRQVARELYVLRERYASESDQPPFRIFTNDVLVALAFGKPRSRPELVLPGRLSPKQARKLGDDVLAAVERALELGPIERWPHLASKDGTDGFSEEDVELHERLKNWRKDAAADLGMDAAYLLNRHVLLRLVRERPRDRAALERIEGFHFWQAERYSDVLLGLLRKFEADVRAGTALQKRRSRWSRD